MSCVYQLRRSLQTSNRLFSDKRSLILLINIVVFNLYLTICLALLNRVSVDLRKQRRFVLLTYSSIDFIYRLFVPMFAFRSIAYLANGILKRLTEGVGSFLDN